MMVSVKIFMYFMCFDYDYLFSTTVIIIFFCDMLYEECHF